MLVDYRKIDTPIHKLNVKVILMAVLAVIVASVVWTNPLYCAALTVLLIIIGNICKFPWKKIGWFFKMAGIASAFIMVITAFTLDPSLVAGPTKNIVLFYLFPGAPCNLGCLLYGIGSSFKIYMVVIAIAIMGYVVPPSDIIQLISRIPIASKQFVFIFSTAWRFIPIIQNQIFNLLNAQKTRGMELEKGRLTEKVKKVVPIVTPLLSNSLEIGSQIALTMEARAFGAKNKNKFIKPLKMNGQAKVMFLACAVVIGVIIYTSVLGFGVI